MTRWRRVIPAGTLLEVSFEQARDEPPQALVLEVDHGHLAWDEQGEEGRALRVWADRHTSVVLRLTGRFAGATLTAWNAWLDHDELEGETVRAGDGMRIEEDDGGAVLHCRGSHDATGHDDLVVRISVHARTKRGDHRARASSE